ncbi:MAG TPA: peptidyl-prolyl cis-trans isomerase [Solirubrobacteraceae bacterium]|nr:peptidyl-prolyl cis-trans isomerase [Solirubrobacteraceae bacterium]
MGKALTPSSSKAPHPAALPRSLAPAAAAILASLTLASCAGGGGHSSSSAAAKGSSASSSTRSATPADAGNQQPLSADALPSAPGGIVARVGPYAITQAAYEHAFAAEVDAEGPATRVVPVPPDFSACVSHMKAAAATSIEAGAATPTSAGALKQECQKKYETLRETVLNRLITNVWVIGGGKELGLTVGEGEIQKNIAEFKQRNYPSEEKFQSYLQSSGQTLADLVFQTRVEFFSQKIRDELKRKVGPFPRSRIAAYYASHKHLYVVPETRDLEIARVKTRAQALKLKREIAAGRSFASIVKTLPLRQPIFSKEGLVKGLKSRVYNEPPLNDAIFAARPGDLGGPIHIFLGWYVFRLKAIHPSRLKPLSEVQAELKRTLPEQLQQKAVAAYIKAWRARWTARSSCAPNYVVRRCREFKATPQTRADDPYTLN